MKRVHFIGIGGTGISAIALMLLERGYQVSGSDTSDSAYFQKVTERGARTIIGHDPALALQADLVVRSSAIKDDDPEVQAAKAAGIPVLKRAEILPEVTADKQTIAIAGSHGKTTTTAMLVTLMTSFDLDPSFILGAEIKDLHTNAHWGNGPHFIIEADEYDYMFLGLKPTISVVTNIEYDHPDCFPTPESYLDAFQKFVLRTQPEGVALLCADDTGIQKLLEKLTNADFEVRTYGFSGNSQYHIQSAKWDGKAYQFMLMRQLPGEELQNLGTFTLPMAGKHNVSNASAALAVLDILGYPPSQATTALASYHGSERRMEVVFEQNGIVILNDYGHHPTQIAATLSALRELYPQKKLWAVWEPHTYSRTQLLKDAYAQVLSEADAVLITRIYAARETDSGFDPQMIANAIPGNKARYIPDFDQLVDYLVEHLNGNDVICVFSAGKGPQLTAKLKASLFNLRRELHS